MVEIVNYLIGTYVMRREQLISFYQSLISFMVISKHQVIALGAQYDLTPVQGHVLFLVEPNKPQPMSHLSSILGCDASNVTGIIDSLERKDFICRTEKPGDRRVKMIALRPKGEQARNAFLQSLADACEQYMFSTFTAEEKEQLAALLNKATVSCPNAKK